MASTLSPNMNLVVPGVGTEAGPQYALDINSSLNILDAHDHSLGNGVQITPVGININANLSFNGNNATNLNYLTLNNLPVQVSPLGSLYMQGNNLFFSDGFGNAIQITASGAVAATVGTLTGAGNIAQFTGSGLTVTQVSTGQYVNVHAGSLSLSPSSTTTASLTLSPPSSIGAGYSITLPTPASQNASPIVMNTDGTMVAANPFDYFMPSGLIMPFAAAIAPSGWLLCNGAAVSRTTYSRLFATIGTNFGFGDGISTFNLPDLRGQFLRGWSNGSGRDPDAALRTAMNPGGNAGDNVGSIQAQATRKNGLSITDPGHVHTLPSAQNIGSLLGFSYQTNTNGTSSSIISASATTGIVLNNGDNETRPINAYVNFLIKI